MRVTVTGATGLIGSKLIRELKARGDDVTVLSRNPDRARERIGAEWNVVAWDPMAGPAPAAALAGRDAVVHLAGEKIDQRWTGPARERIRASREVGTRNLVNGIRAAEPRPGVLVSASGVGYYGPRGDEVIDEDTPPGTDFLAEVCHVWEREAQAAENAGLRVVRVRQGIVLAKGGGALSKMLPPFKLGVGGPVAGGRQYLPWIHLDDVVGLYLEATADASWTGPVNGAAPEPVTNRDFSRALGRALHRPALAPVPALALKLLYGDMAQMVITGQRAVPTRPLALGYAYRHPDLDEALRSALDGG